MQDLFNKIKKNVALKGLDTIPVAILWIAKDGSLLRANRKFCEERGYTLEEIKGLHIRDVNPLISTKGWRKYWKQVKKNGVMVIESEHMMKDGKVFPVELQSNYIEIEGLEVIFTIITPLLERDRYRDLLDMTSNHSKVVGWEWDGINETYTYTSYLKTLCGLEDETELSEFMEILQQYLSKPQFKELRKALLLTTENFKDFDLDFRIRGKTGVESWIKIRGKPLVVDEELLKINGTIQDISEHRNFSDEMYLLKHYMDNSDDQVFWTNDQGKFSYANIKACETLGYSAKELYRLHVWDIVRLTKEEWMSHWEKLKKVGYFELENIQKDREGNSIPVKTRKFALQYEDNYYNLAVVRNATKEKQREAQLQASLDKISELQSKLSQENTYLKEEILKEYNFRNIISKSDNYKKVLAQVQDVAETDATVLVLGESGTGKELLASAVHELSKRSDKPYIKVNCAALPENLIESELFGHEKGAFTGAYMKKVGRFELADGGTIFLDEIGELPIGLQAKMLRVLQEGEFQRVGSSATTRVDVRIIAATNRDLVDQVREGKFREDLFFRLNVFPIVNIPLRERKEDIPLLAQYFMERFSEKMHKSLEGLSPASLKRLSKYDYPGNIRELENIIERAVITSKGKVLKLAANLFVNKLNEEEKEDNGLVTFDELQKNYIIKVLEHTNWKVTGKGGAAGILGMNGKTLYSKMTKFNISKPK